MLGTSHTLYALYVLHYILLYVRIASIECNIQYKILIVEDNYAADDLHKFSKFNNVEPDSCEHLRSRTLTEKDDLLRKYQFCRRCLVSPLSSHHTEDTCRPSNDWFVCDHPDCDIHQAVCVKHQDLNMKELEKRQKTIGLPQMI